MQQPAQDPDWERIENFIGYGRPDAPVVFLGMEEGLRRDADLLADLLARSAFEPYMDLVQAQSELDGPSSYFGEGAITQKTWRPMCDLMLRRKGIPSPTLRERVRYQADHLGRRDGDTLLAELLPYPHSDSGQWLYDSFGKFATRQEYEQKLLPHRLTLLAEALGTHPRELIVAYGKANWPHYKRLFHGVSWQPEGECEYGTWNGAHVVLAHQLAGKAFNTDAQLERFAAIALRIERSPLQDDRHPRTVRSTSVGSTFSARRSANLAFRKAFGALVAAYRSEAGLSPDQVSEKAKVFAGQGNPGGVRNLEASRGWVDPRFAEGVFRAVGIPNAEQIGAAYTKLKDGFRGVTREKD